MPKVFSSFYSLGEKIIMHLYVKSSPIKEEAIILPKGISKEIWFYLTPEYLPANNVLSWLLSLLGPIKLSQF